MNALYVTATEHFSGKTAICLGLGKWLQSTGYRTGYLKPVSFSPILLPGHPVDEDAVFIKEMLQLEREPWELSPIVVTPDLLNECLDHEEVCLKLHEQVKEEYAGAGAGNDFLILEGGGSLRQGGAIGLTSPAVAEMLDVPVLVVVKCRSKLRMLDDALTARFRLGDRLLGVVLNRVPDEALSFINETALPFLAERGITVLGILPEDRHLAAISVGELVDALGARILVGEDRLDGLCESLMVGAMGAREALGRFRAVPNKAVFTGGDRTEVQLAALESSTVALVLTGNIQPLQAVVERAERQGVAVLLVPHNTMEAVETIDQAFGKTRLGHPDKLARFEALMAAHMDFNRLLTLLKA
ncbi:MAG: phosphotransacetylase family protein [Chloroflexota bacterium]